MSTTWIDDAPAVGSVAFQASATSTSTTITCPSVQQYDVGVLIDFSSNGASPASAVVPSGFTSLTTTTSGGYRGTASYKIFDGTESGTSLTGLSGSGFVSKILLTFRPSSPISAVSASTWLTELGTADPAAQSIAASGQQTPLIRIAGAADNAGTTPSFSSGTFDATVTQPTGTGRQIAGYAIQNSAGTSDSADMNDLGINWLVSGWLSVS